MLCPFQSDVLLSVDNGCFLCFLCSESLHVYAYTNVLIYSVFTCFYSIYHNHIYNYIYIICVIWHICLWIISRMSYRPSLTSSAHIGCRHRLPWTATSVGARWTTLEPEVFGMSLTGLETTNPRNNPWKAWKAVCYKWNIPSGNLLHSYWKWPFIVSVPIKNCDFSIVMLVMLVYQRLSITSNSFLTDQRLFEWSLRGHPCNSPDKSGVENWHFTLHVFFPNRGTIDCQF